MTASTRIYTLRLSLLAILFTLVASRANAHDPSLSGIRILFRNTDVVVNVTTHISRLVRADGDGKSVLSLVETDLAVRKRLHVVIDGQRFIPGKANLIDDKSNDLLTWQSIKAGPGRECDIESRIYPEDAGSRTVVSVLHDGVVVRDAMLDLSHPDSMGSGPKQTKGAVALQYIREGIFHILGGPDHIAFVLGLLLLGGSLKSLLKTVTAFTLAHSVTLSLAATGVCRPSPRLIEPLIALSIVAIAAENLRPHRQNTVGEKPVRDLRPYFAFGFGLIHGFGFAGALAEVGLPHNAIAIALASFNVGVELGQAAIVLSVAPLIAYSVKKWPVLQKRFAFVCSVAIALAGSYWFIERLAPGR